MTMMMKMMNKEQANDKYYTAVLIIFTTKINLLLTKTSFDMNFSLSVLAVYFSSFQFTRLILFSHKL